VKNARGLNVVYVSRLLLLTSLLALLLVATPLVVTNPGPGLDQLDKVVGDLVHRLCELSAKGVNVTPVLVKLDEAIAAYERGDVESAERALDKAISILSKLEATADEVYRFIVLSKVLAIAGLASIPILVYTLLPRVYLHLWFKTRRRWLVRRY
jgi:hypothetical protein